MVYKFVGSFSEAEKRRIASALDRSGMIQPFNHSPAWTVFCKEIGHISCYLAVSDHLQSPGKTRRSYWGATVDELIADIQGLASRG